jgi:type IV pilus assembly protein PilB
MNPRAAHFGAEEVDLRGIAFNRELLALIPAEFARRHRILPVLDSPGRVVVAMADPSDLGAIDALHARLQRVVEICVADESQLHEFMGRLYASEGSQGGPTNGSSQ